MERHHGALAKADERERARRKLAARELGVEELLEPGRGGVHAGPALLGVAHGECEPLPAGHSGAEHLRGVRRHERRIGQQLLPRPADLDEVATVGPVAVQEHDELARGTARLRLEPRTVQLGHCKDLRIMSD